MKIKLFIGITFMVMLATGAQSQSGTTYGLRAGVNFQNINGKNAAGDRLEYRITPGFNIGVNAEIPVAQDYFIQPGVLFTTKGAKEKNSDSKYSLSYVEVPVNFLYKPVLGTGKLLLGFGPYAAFGVQAKYKPESGNDVDLKFRNSVTTSEAVSGNPYIKRFDAGANFLAGYELSNNLSLQLNAQLGLVKINPKYEEITTDKSSFKNTGFGISAGYRF